MECDVCLSNGFYCGILFMASLHGLLLAAILFLSESLKSRANKFLALSLLGMSIILAYEATYYSDIIYNVPTFLQYLPFYIRTTLVAGIFYFVIFLINPQHQLSNFEKIGFVFILLEILADLLFIPTNLIFENPITIKQAEDTIVLVGQIIGIIASIILLPIALQRVNQYQKYLFDHHSTTSKKSLAWLRIYLIGNLLLTALWMVSFTLNLLGYAELYEASFFYVSIGLIIMLYGIGYFVILQSRWFQIVPITTDVHPEKGDQKLSSKTDIYHVQLKNLMKEEKLYEDIDLTLTDLSERLQISSGYLSQIINEKEEKNFFEFVNTYRVDAVKQKLLDEEFQNYTIMGIALESGFKSKSTFNAVFKKFTGQTPSTFKKLNTL